MKQYVHNVKLSGRDTSISLEPEFWEQFRSITMERPATSLGAEARRCPSSGITRLQLSDGRERPPLGGR
jgi:Ribbon-helix-helix domain